ncbi:hypothetical protein HPSD74_0515 [Glaesserella parasuis D74]|nr:hypothetical protein HPSD74_0515 [Glaesserella parasuis D74]
MNFRHKKSRKGTAWVWLNLNPKGAVVKHKNINYFSLTLNKVLIIYLV